MEFAGAYELYLFLASFSLADEDEEADFLRGAAASSLKVGKKEITEMNRVLRKTFQLLRHIWQSPYPFPFSGSESELSDDEEDDDEDEDDDDDELELPCQLFFSFSSIPGWPLTGFFAVIGCSACWGDSAADWPLRPPLESLLSAGDGAGAGEGNSLPCALLSDWLEGARLS